MGRYKPYTKGDPGCLARAREERDEDREVMTQTQLNLEGMGLFYVSVLEQDQVWRDGMGRTHKLTELTTSHLNNIESFLRRKGEYLRIKWCDLQHRRHFATAPTVIGHVDGKDILGSERPIFSDDGGNLDAAHEGWMRSELERPFDAWLADRPLIKAIRAILQERNRPSRDS